MPRPSSLMNCWWCRMMHALAFSGIGAFIGGMGSIWLGVERQEAIWWALLGSIVVVGFVNRKRD